MSPEASKPLAAAIYVRISADPKGERLGVQRQREDCQRLAEIHGWTVAEVYEDNDLSASTVAKKRKPRPAFDRMIADCEAGRRDGIIVYSTDRLTRRLIELAQFLAWRKAHEIAYLDTEGADTSSANGRMIIQIKGAVAEQEAERISERVIRANRQSAESGKARGSGNLRPFGYADDRVTIVEPEAVVLREVAERVMAGEPLGAICRDLDNRGTGTITGAKWTKVSMRRMLMSPRITGLREYKGEIVGEAQWTGILDRETWENVRTVLDDPERKKSAKQGNARRHLLTGIVVCGACDRPMGGKAPHDGLKRYSYACAATKAQGCQGRTYRDLLRVDALVIEAVLARLEGLEAARAVTAPLAGEISQAEAKMQRLREAYARDDVDDADYFPMLRAARAKVDDLRREQAGRMRSDLLASASGNSARESWDRATLARKRAIVKELIEAVIIRPVPRIVGAPFDPESVDIVWKVQAGE